MAAPSPLTKRVRAKTVLVAVAVAGSAVAVAVDGAANVANRAADSVASPTAQAIRTRESVRQRTLSLFLREANIPSAFFDYRQLLGYVLSG